MNEYLLIIVYVVGVLYSTFAYGALVGNWDFDPMILVVFFWPLVMVVGPLLGLLLPFYILGVKCMLCIKSCDRRCKERRRSNTSNSAKHSAPPTPFVNSRSSPKHTTTKPEISYKPVPPSPSPPIEPT